MTTTLNRRILRSSFVWHRPPLIRRGVILPRLMDPYVLPQGRHGAEPGLVGDGPVAGAP
jgi:hypothetical protein